jgi:hypothetical protein
MLFALRFIHMIVPTLMSSLPDLMRAALFVGVLNMNLNECTYHAELADITYNISLVTVCLLCTECVFLLANMHTCHFTRFLLSE